MGMFVNKDKDGGVSAYVGKGIKDGKKFDGNSMRNSDGTKNYTHVKDGKVVRAPGVPGKRSPKW